MLTNRFKQRLSAGECMLGSWVTFTDPSVSEIMARAGFDWLTVDMEHSPIMLGEAQQLIRVIELCGTCALVRLPANDPTIAKRVMDAGASGVIVPMVNSPIEAEQAVQAVKYPPSGKRSVGIARAQGFGPGFDAYVQSANEQSLVFVQIEHIDAVTNLEAILKVPGINGLMVGPYDLSGSMGIPGQLDSPLVQQALTHILEMSRAHGVPAGIHIVRPDPEEVIRKFDDGFRLVAYSVDFLLLGDTCRRDVGVMRSRLGAAGEHE
jgi:2-keto-3-deoxy-L-rhamnonate aldolase RhmA